ncbi:GDSL esterase/lipase [Sesamum alatum]|uniref:GDSL esterase/lipase n=1 Tax=Sesamum alatum TaxID=300844 RepID=A0AAE2CUW2_9LAMI|nr:GDSL esterase/lipase [Sesamum alatum]
MSDTEDTFDLSGPVHLTTVDWTNPDDQRSVAASLVKGVYVLHQDRKEGREGCRALAPRWWEFFHFQLCEQLIDKDDFSVFGAIFQLTSGPSDSNRSADQAPSYTIAFRGTIPKSDTFLRDLKLNIRIIRNRLHPASRVETALQAVRDVVATHGSSNVWLAGHSQGAATGMLAGKTMAKTGVFLETFLFNPPFVSHVIKRIKVKKVRHGIRLTRSVITAGLLKMRKYHESNWSGPLSAWWPRLFVNAADWICAEYIGYFEHREWMEKIGAGGIERLAAQHSVGGLVLDAIASTMGKPSEEPVHLIPSASLTVNRSPALHRRETHGIKRWWKDRIEAHGIRQWWRPDLLLESNIYTYM